MILCSRGSIICAVAAATALWGQAPTGQITGAVSDSTGAAVAGATLTLVQSTMNVTRVSKSTTAGVYAFPALPPGLYNLKVEATGFATEVRNGIELQVGQVAGLDFVLKVGSVAEVIEVSGGAPVLETETASIGTVVENRRILELPLNGRNYLQLVSLIPGATTNSRPTVVAQIRQGGTRSDFTVSVSGQRLAFNRYTLDGIENTDINFAGYLLAPSIDALQEFKVESGVFQAEFGRATSQVNVTTKSGTNQFHGALFEFVRNSQFDAKNFFDRKDAPIPPFKRNQFGVTVGGPVVIPKLYSGKDRLFFMFNYEGLRERKGLTQVGIVPLTENRTGNFGSVPIFDPDSRVFGANNQVTSVQPFSGNVIPANRIHRVAKRMLDFIPLGNAGISGQTARFVNSEARRSNSDQFTTRLDFAESRSSNWLFRYSRSKEDGFVPTALPEQGNNVTNQIQQGLLGNTHVFGATKVNEFRFGVNYLAGAFIQTRAFKEDQNIVKQLGIPDIPAANVPLWYGLPVLRIAQLSTVGDCSDCPWTGYNTVFEFVDNFSWTKGRHTMKFGGDYRRVRFNNSVPGRPRGRFDFDGRFTQNPLAANRNSTGSAVADFLLGYQIQSETLVGAPVSNFRNFYLGAFIQDQWRVTPKLTVNLGLRYENEPPWLDKYDAIVNLDFRWNHSIIPTFVRAGTGDLFEGNPAFKTPTTIPEVRDGRFGRRTQKWDKNDFAPRLGIAYQLNPKTVIRTAAGIYYVREIGNAEFETVRNPPFSAQRGEPSQQDRPNLSFDRPFTLPVSVPTFVLAVQYNEPSAYVGEWSFGVQRQLTRDMSLEATYLGSGSSHLKRMAIYNEAPPGLGDITPRRPFPQLGNVQLMSGAAHATYHALLLRAQQRFAHGFTLLSSFSWGKSIDNGSSVRNAAGDAFTPSNANDHSLERGLSGFNFGRRWTNSWLYELPFGKGKRFPGSAGRGADLILGGWQLGGILTLQDGFPVTAGCGPGNWQNGGGACYPDSVGISPNLPRDQQRPDRFFNTAAFVNRLPGGAQFRFGNAARNTIIGPGILSWDASVNKNFRITEATRLEFRAEGFNLPNHPIFGLPDTSVGGSNYGKITGTAIDSRQLQLALKLVF